jgi:hypothetical protein
VGEQRADPEAREPAQYGSGLVLLTLGIAAGMLAITHEQGPLAWCQALA